MSVKAYNKNVGDFVKIASLQSDDIVVNNESFESNNVADALAELKNNLTKLKSNVAWIYQNGTQGGGSGISDNQIVVTGFNDDNVLIVQENQAVTFKVMVASKTANKFTLNVAVSSTNSSTSKSITVFANEDATVNLGVLDNGTYNVIITGKDSTGFPLTNWQGTIIVGYITIDTSNFNSSNAYEISSVISVLYTIKVESYLANRGIRVWYKVDGGEEHIISNPMINLLQTINLNQNGNEYTLGEHIITIYASITDATGTSETIVSKDVLFLVKSDVEFAIYVPSTTSVYYTLGNTLRIPYSIIANQNRYSYFNVSYTLTNTATQQIAASGTIDGITYSNAHIITIDTSASNNNYEFTVGEYSLLLSAVANVDNKQSYGDKPFIFNLTEGNTSENFAIWDVDPDGLIADFNCFGKLNTETSVWRNSVVSLEAIANATFTNVDGLANGFVVTNNALSIDPDNNDLLKLYGESYGYIDYDLFDASSSSKTFSIVYKYRDNGVPTSTIISAGDYVNTSDGYQLRQGLNINQEEIKMMFGSVSVSTYNVDDEWIQCDIVIEPVSGSNGLRLIKIYINGVITACTEASISDSGITRGIYIGCKSFLDDVNDDSSRITEDYSDILIKSIRIYNNALTSTQIVRNYIANDYYLHANEGSTDYDKTRNLELRDLNSLVQTADGIKYEEGNSICGLPKVYVALTSDQRTLFNAMTDGQFTTDSDDPARSYRPTCNIIYESADGSLRYDSSQIGSQTNADAYIELQGTTSLGYNKKNYNICFGTWENGEPIYFSPNFNSVNQSKDNWLPENKFTLKCDLIDSSHANNVGSANFVESVFGGLNLELPAMNVNSYPTYGASVKYAIKGFPVLLYIQDGKGGNTETYSFYGVYMFDLGRDSFFNLGLDKIDPNYNMVVDPTTGIVERGTLRSTAHDGNVFAYESDANSSQDAGAFAQVDPNLIRAAWTRRFPSTAESDAIGIPALEKMMRTVVDASGKGIYALNSTTGEPYIGNDTGITDEFGYAMTEASKQPSLDTFQESNIIDTNHSVSYLIVAYALGMVDNLGKNLVMKTWNGASYNEQIGSSTNWYPTFYDMDTILGLDNTGIMRYNASVDLDAFAPDWGTTEQPIAGNTLQMLTYTAPPAGITTNILFGETVATLNGAGGKYKGLYNTTESRLWDLIRTYYYSTAASTNFLSVYNTLRMSGILSWESIFSNYQQIIGKIGQIYYNRDAEIKYLVQYEKVQNGNTTTTGRHNLTFMHGTRELFTKRWLKQRIAYLDSRFNSSAGVGSVQSDKLQVRIGLNSSTTYDVKTISPVFLTRSQEGGSSNTVLVYDKYYTPFPITSTVGNRPIEINNAPLLTEVSGINRGTLQRVELSNASKLLYLNLSGSTQLVELNVDNCVSLREINISGCTNLLSSSLDLSSCTNLQRIDVSNSSLNQLSLPVNGVLKELVARSTNIYELRIEGQPFLQTLDLSDSVSLTTVVIQNCNNLETVIITNSQLQELRIEQCDKLKTILLSDNAKLNLFGVTQCPQVQEIDLSNCTSSSFARYYEDPEIRKQRAIELDECVNLQSLNLNNCSAQVIRLPHTLSSLTDLNAISSQLMQTIYVKSLSSGGAGETIFSVYSNNVKTVPAVDLSRFAEMSNVKFTNNTVIQSVTGLSKDWSANTAGIFRGCKKLYRVSGSLSIGYGYEFAEIPKASEFKLNNWGTSTTMTSETYNNIVSGISGEKLTLHPKTATLNYTFWYNYAIGGTDARYVCYTAGASGLVSYLNSTFSGTSLFNSDNEPNGNHRTLPSDIFSLFGNKLITVNYTFNGAGLSGDFPGNIFEKNIELTQCDGCFFQNNFTALTVSFNNIFANCDRLTSCSKFLGYNMNLTSQTTLDPSLFFANTSSLVYCDDFIGAHGQSPGYEEDTYINFSRRTGLTLSATNSDKIFAHTPNLISCAGAFAKCTFVGALSPNIFGGELSSSTQEGANGYSYPTRLTDISFCFFDSNVSMPNASGSIFKHLSQLQNCAGCFARNPEVVFTFGTGGSSEASDIFRYSSSLTNVRRFFEDVTVTGTLETRTNATAPHPLFASNSSLQDARNLFKRSSSMLNTEQFLTGKFPQLLFAGCPNIKSLDGIFYGRTDLSLIPNNIFWLGTNVNGEIDTTSPAQFTACVTAVDTFNGCTGTTDISTIPGLFNSLSYLTSVSGFFHNCGSYQNNQFGVVGNIPSGLFSGLTQLRDVSNFFNGCWGLTNDVNNQFVSADLFADASLLVNATGLFSNTRPKIIPAALFASCINLSNVSYMFYNADKSNATLYSSMFVNNSNISDISYFFANGVGYESRSYIDSAGALSGIFRYYVAGSGGQRNIQNASYAFYKNPGLTSVAPVPIWDVNWQPKPTTYTNMYTGTNCTDVPEEFGGTV